VTLGCAGVHLSAQVLAQRNASAKAAEEGGAKAHAGQAGGPQSRPSGLLKISVRAAHEGHGPHGGAAQSMDLESHGHGQGGKGEGGQGVGGHAEEGRRGGAGAAPSVALPAWFFSTKS
jgi:hypothetical protein